MSGYFYFTSFFYNKRFNAGRFPIVKLNHHFCFSRVKGIYNLFIYFFMFSFFWHFYFSHLNQHHLTLVTFFFHSVFFLVLHVRPSLFNANILAWYVWIISSLNISGKKNFLNMSSLKIMVNLFSYFIFKPYFIKIIIKRFQNTVVNVISTVNSNINVVQLLKKIFFYGRFCFLSWFLVNYNEIFFEFGLLNSEMFVDMCDKPTCMSYQKSTSLEWTFFLSELNVS